MIRDFLLLVLVSFSGICHSQTISGYVRDEASGESLIGATIFDRKQEKGTLSNNYGFYSITTSKDSAVLHVSFVGYDPQLLKIRMNRDTSLVIFLKSDKLLDEIVVTGSRAESINESTRMATVSVPTTQIKAIPAFMGEVDVVKAMQLIPGVSGGNEGSAYLIIRGGNPDQSLIQMDGATIYNPTHLYGFFSAFNPDAVNHVEIVKGGFPARYGGRLSGIADITLKEGNMNKFGGEASLGLLASRFMIEGPIKKNQSSFIISGRRGYLGLMRTLIERRMGAGVTDGFYFYDLNVKVNHRINRKNRIYASAYTGDDYAAGTDTNESVENVNERVRTTTSTTRNMNAWGNTVASIRWNHEINNKFFFNVGTSYSKYNLEIGNYYSTHIQYAPDGAVEHREATYFYKSGIEDICLRIDFDLIPNADHYIRFGSTVTNHNFTPGVGVTRTSDATGLPQVQADVTGTNSNEINFYIEDDFSLTKTTKINLGVHGVAYKVDHKTWYGLQPRVALRQSLTPSLSLKASYSYMQQYLHMLTNAGLGQPTDLWVPVTDKVKPQSAHQVSLGLAKNLGQRIEISLEGYYKTMQNLIEYKEGASYLDAKEAWYDKIEIGRGVAYGVELFIQKRAGRLTGWAGYTLSWNKRQFDNINNGQWFYYRYDHRHDIKITGNYKISKRWDISSTFIYATGNAITLALDRMPWDYNAVGPASYFNLIMANEGRNNYRMPSYHRLDLGGNFTFNVKRTEHKVGAGVYNVYDRKNPFYLTLNRDKIPPKIESMSLFPILPSFSYSMKF